MAIATSERFRTAREGAWAKALFDRGLQPHRRLADGNDGSLPPLRMFGVRSLAESRYPYHARMLANIARAVEAGLGSRPAADPPPLYSFDHDTGRLAVTTPRYSTAIVPDNRGVFAYGGIEPARLFGPGQAVAAGVGGTPPAAFGVVVTDPRGRTVLASQHTRRGRLRVTRSPHGTPLRPRSYPARPYAGPFADLRAKGVVSSGGVRIESTHRFTSDAIETRWNVACPGRCAGYRLRAHFPTWGRHAVIDAIGHDGKRFRLAGAGAARRSRVALASMAALVLGGSRSGYRLIPVGAPSGARLSVVTPRPSATNPAPGPSLAIGIGGSRRPATRNLAVRVETTG